MLLIASQALMLAGLVMAATGLVWERRAGRWQVSKLVFVMLLAALTLGAVGALLALIGAALD
jgi:hypothetical protein